MTQLDGHAVAVETVVTMGDAAVARVGAVRFASGLAPVSPTGLATGDLLADDLGADQIPVEDEAIAVPQGNGLGFDVPRGE